MARGFSVQGVEIEGFKGFTSPKAIDFKGRHVCLVGQNGNGKSSIVEAVRWGLFGSAFRPNEVVKNQHYSGDCRVTVKLVRDGQLWNLRRTLNLGTGSSSDPILTDQRKQTSYKRNNAALLYRLTHHVHILEMNGESYRLHHVHILEMNGDSYRLKRSRESAAYQVSDEPEDS